MVTARLIAAIPGSFVLDYVQINDPAALDALFAFVGSEARAGESRTAFRKQFAGSLEDGFENWGALQAFLKRTAPVFLAPPAPTSAAAGRLSRRQPTSSRTTGAIQSSISASRESSGNRQ